MVLRDTLMADHNERTVNSHFKSSAVVRKLVMLVLVSLNQILPAQEPNFIQQQDDAEEKPEIQVEKVDLTTDLDLASPTKG